jgi:hypothetical protein
MIRFIGLVGACAALVGCSAATPTEEFTLVQGNPVLTDVKFTDRPAGATGKAHGDLLAFDAPISRDGEVVGDVSGLLTTVDIPAPDATGRDALEERFATLVFRFNDVDTIVVGGSAVYPPAESEMSADAPQLRAVLGGTGAYVAAAGEVETVRNADGTYSHRFTLHKVK